MSNLLEETIEVLKDYDKDQSDIVWCGNNEVWFTWEEFKKIADIEYENGYGIEQIATDLLIVGKDFWLERHEYDGSEWWEFKAFPTKSKTHITPKFLCRSQFKDYYGIDMKVSGMNPLPITK